VGRVRGLEVRAAAAAVATRPARQQRSDVKDVGGRVDWSHARNLIAFDRAGSDGFYDVYTMNPDGSDERCLTCDKAALPNKHIGNPAWHPSGNWIAFQAQNRSSGNDDVATPGAGLRNDIWPDGRRRTRFFQVTTVEAFVGGVLHPVFSHRETSCSGPSASPRRRVSTGSGS